jgi:hypothetical protein
VLKSNGDFLSSCTNTIYVSSMFFGWHYKVSTSKRRKRGASSSGEGSAHDESYVPSQLEATSSYASGSHDNDMEFDSQVYQGPFKEMDRRLIKRLA